MNLPQDGHLATNVSDQRMANAIRALAMDAVEAAHSGHPGLPMGAADVATVLFTRHLNFDPFWPEWPNRDRFVLSAGHGSMMLYALLYLTGYDGITLDDIKNFRQLGSPCAGHPEYGAIPGIETTTGPLGQGFANGVGMALAERLTAAKFPAAGIDHYTYVLVSDGCLMEGISHEAASLAGHLKLSRLIVLFDDNHVSIDGATELTVSDDQPARFAALGWDVSSVDGHNPEEISQAISAAKNADRPSLIACRTIIGFGAPNKQGTAATHGAPLGAEEVAAARRELGWDYPAFVIPDDIMDAWRGYGGRGRTRASEWQSRLDGQSHQDRDAFRRFLEKTVPNNFADGIDQLKRDLLDAGASATRRASQKVLEFVNQHIPNTLGGSADLTGSNNTKTADLAAIQADDFSGRYIHYGVREHAMAAIMNGLALHGGFIPYSGTFLVFSDYCRPAIRLAAMMGQPVIFVMTHDSIGLGEDGPTHQPIEHLAALRAVPNLQVFRPADAVETAECWALALASTATPSVIVLSRQTLPIVRDQHDKANLCARGAYELRAADGTAQVTLIATGSEVEITLGAREQLQRKGIPTRVVSAPCLELFDNQDAAYRRQTLADDTIRIAVEAASSFGWERYVGTAGKIIGIDRFGASAPYQDLYREFGITADAVVTAAEDAIAQRRPK